MRSQPYCIVRSPEDFRTPSRVFNILSKSETSSSPRLNRGVESDELTIWRFVETGNCNGYHGKGAQMPRQLEIPVAGMAIERAGAQ